MKDVLQIEIDGFVNAHNHSFQRALRGRVEGGDFWAWREAMLELARGQTPGHVRTSYAVVYAEMRDAGYTAFGEFHYLGLEELRAAGLGTAVREHRLRLGKVGDEECSR